MGSTLACLLLVGPAFSDSNDTASAPATTLGLCSPPLLFTPALYTLKWVTLSHGGPPGRSVQLRVKLLAWAYQEQAANQLPCLSLFYIYNVY